VGGMTLRRNWIRCMIVLSTMWGVSGGFKTPNLGFSLLLYAVCGPSPPLSSILRSRVCFTLARVRASSEPC